MAHPENRKDEEKQTESKKEQCVRESTLHPFRRPAHAHGGRRHCTQVERRDPVPAQYLLDGLFSLLFNETLPVLLIALCGLDIRIVKYSREPCGGPGPRAEVRHHHIPVEPGLPDDIIKAVDVGSGNGLNDVVIRNTERGTDEVVPRPPPAPESTGL